MHTKAMQYFTGRASACAMAMVFGIAASQVAQAAKVAGTVEGSINGDPVNVEGVCSIDDNAFEFWSDGTDFAVNKDSNGDGMYLNISVTKMGDNHYNALWYSRGGELVYKGMFEYAARDERSMSVDTEMGRADMPARFEVRCSG